MGCSLCSVGVAVIEMFMALASGLFFLFLAFFSGLLRVIWDSWRKR